MEYDDLAAEIGTLFEPEPEPRARAAARPLGDPIRYEF
jgi:hypothetical protein